MRPNSDLTLLLVLVALFIFHSPFTRWWAGQELPWYTVFLFWFAVILLVAIGNLLRDSQRGD